MKVGSIIKSLCSHLYSIPILSKSSNSGLRPLTIIDLLRFLNVSFVCCRIANEEYVIISLTHSVKVTLYGYIKKDLENSDYFVAIRANQAPIIETENFNKKKIFFLLKEELDLPMYSVHNITQPMFWYNSPKTNSRAQRAFPRMSNRRVEWKWIDEE